MFTILISNRHHDKEGIFGLNAETFKKFLPEDRILRLFKLHNLDKPNSPNGALPNYRFWNMDAKSFGAMAYNLPEADGSSCTKMAASLRKVLGKEFNFAVGVHLAKMSGDDFRKSIDAAWNWLDGKSLLKA